MPVRMLIKGLMMDPVTNMPILVLRDEAGERTLPIWIGMFEAHAVAIQLENSGSPRPMTHDLLKHLVEALGATVSEVHITDVRDGTFFALIYLVANGEQTGRLAPMLERAAGELERNAETRLAWLAALLQPALIVLMGAIVLVLVLAVMLPIQAVLRLLAGDGPGFDALIGSLRVKEEISQAGVEQGPPTNGDPRWTAQPSRCPSSGGGAACRDRCRARPWRRSSRSIEFDGSLSRPDPRRDEIEEVTAAEQMRVDACGGSGLQVGLAVADQEWT